MNQHEFSVQVYCEDLGYSKEIELVADWSYTPYCKGAREDGVPVEPDEPESWEIGYVRSNSVEPDPLELLVVEEINSTADFDHLIEAIKAA